MRDVTKKVDAIIEVGNVVKTGNWESSQIGRIYSIDGCSPTLNCCTGRGTSRKSSFVIQRVGDRDKVQWSIKNFAFTIASNPMSDRMQLVLERYEDRLDDMPK